MLNTFSKEYCVGLKPMYGVFVARYAHPCVLARRANPL
jgi:hypothetical protein